MQFTDRIELRRFVGREFLLWLWFESEVFEATLSTKAHGSFGLWLEGRLVLSEGKESTTIKGTSPGHHREAKEALLRGKLPERAGLHLSWGDNESTLTLKGEAMALSGLVLPTKLDKADADAPPALAPPPARRKKRAETRQAGDEEAEAFYERMHLTRDVENILESLYADFLALRLSRAWDDHVLPALEAWTGGEDVTVEAYQRARSEALGRGKRK